jgi:outer membrane protein, heavy metal efflux system
MCQHYSAGMNPLSGRWRTRVVATVLLGPAALQAQAPLSLRDAVQRARAHSPVARLADARVQGAIGRGREQTAIANPFVEYRRENVGADVLPDIFATAAWTLPVSPKRFALMRASAAATDRARADSVQLVQELDAAVATAYVSAARDLRLADIAHAERAALLAIAVYDSTRASQGASAELVAIRARVAADRAALGAAGADALAARSRAQLAQLLVLSADSVLPDTAILSALPSPEQLRGDAQRSPALRTARAAEQEAARRASVERMAVVPDVVVTGGTKQSGGIDSYVASVGLAVPLFNFSRGARQRSQADAAVAAAERALTEQRLQAQVTGALAALRALLDAAPTPAMRQRAQDVASITAAAYTEGGATLLELLESQRVRADADNAVVRWQAEVLHAFIEWRRVTGTPQSEMAP